MQKLDLKKELKHLYLPSAKKVATVEVQPMNYLMIDGKGDPNTSQEYMEAMGVLYGIAYMLKFMLKGKGPWPDFVVPPLEGLWWADNMDDFLLGNKDNWLWTSLIMQPDFVTADHVSEAVAELRRKKATPGLEKLRYEVYQEGLCAQIMHTGSYSEERPTIEKLHNYIESEGYQRRGKHHEIYLSDPRRTPPEKLKTVIRQPIGR
jgi:hypothetical protein